MKRKAKIILLFFAAVAGFLICMDLLRGSGGRMPVDNNGAGEADRLYAGYTPPEIYILEQLGAGSFDTGASRFLTGSYDAIRELATAGGGKNDAIRNSFDTLFGGPSLVYMQGCTIGNVRDEIAHLRTFRGQLEECRGRSEKAGYYLYRIDEQKTYRLDGVTGFVFFTFIATAAADEGIYGEMRPVNPGHGLFRTVSESDSITCSLSGDMYVCSAAEGFDGAVQIPSYYDYGLDILWLMGWVDPWYEL